MLPSAKYCNHLVVNPLSSNRGGVKNIKMIYQKKGKEKSKTRVIKKVFSSFRVFINLHVVGIKSLCNDVSIKYNVVKYSFLAEPFLASFFSSWWRHMLRV